MDNDEPLHKWERHEERFEDVALAIETLWRAYGEVNEWIRAADIKAGTVLAANGVIIVAAVAMAVGTGSFTSIVLTHHLVGFFLIASMVAVIVSSIYAALCLTPILSTGAELCLLFIGHIHRHFPTVRSYEQAVRTTLTNPEANLKQISQEVWNSGRVADRKLAFATWSIRYFILSLFCILLTLLLAYG